MKTRLENILGILFGTIFMTLVALVTVETIVRKLFNVSLQGVDELGGYALAIGSTISFSLAVFGRNHIRVDVLHQHYPDWLKAVMNWLSAFSLAAFAVFLCWVAIQVLLDSVTYGSTAQTPWATPLIYPQSLWYAGLVMFAIVSVCFAAWATYLLFTGKEKELIREFQPKSAKEELKEELDDLAQRSNLDEIVKKV
ncbi:TRAP transporter small permease subunit [Zwartia sp.]|uniref:TRAP transporter small permease subunit n=1 Tax=Zwartia sp. TaxID=2978004 RepID=UPI003BB08196